MARSGSPLVWIGSTIDGGSNAIAFEPAFATATGSRASTTIESLRTTRETMATRDRSINTHPRRPRSGGAPFLTKRRITPALCRHHPFAVVSSVYRCRHGAKAARGDRRLRGGRGGDRLAAPGHQPHA